MMIRIESTINTKHLNKWLSFNVGMVDIYKARMSSMILIGLFQPFHCHILYRLNRSYNPPSISHSRLCGQPIKSKSLADLKSHASLPS